MGLGKNLIFSFFIDKGYFYYFECDLCKRRVIQEIQFFLTI